MGPIEETRPRLAPAFGEAVAAYDLPTGEHSARVGALARAVGAVLELHQLGIVAADIETHHERFDGSGYPAGYAGEEIPLIGRIVGLVDVYDSMTQQRSYRRHVFTPDETLGYLAESSGTLFDPTLVPVVIEVARSK